MMRPVYLASSYGRRGEMAEKATDLPAVGMFNVGRWVNGGEEGLSRADIAVLDIEDIDRAQTIIVCTSERHAPVGGGHLWEFGYAYAKGKRCIVIGPVSTVFVTAPTVQHFDTWEQFIEAEKTR